MPRAPRPVSTIFGGAKSVQQNALYTAFDEASDASGVGVYDFLEKTPRATLTVELVAALERLGYTITTIAAERARHQAARGA